MSNVLNFCTAVERADRFADKAWARDERGEALASLDREAALQEMLELVIDGIDPAGQAGATIWLEEHYGLRPVYERGRIVGVSS